MRTLLLLLALLAFPAAAQARPSPRSSDGAHAVDAEQDRARSPCSSGW